MITNYKKFDLNTKNAFIINTLNDFSINNISIINIINAFIENPINITSFVKLIIRYFFNTFSAANTDIIIKR